MDLDSFLNKKMETVDQTDKNQVQKMAANPAELTHAVDAALGQIQSNFEQMATTILGKLDEMGKRMDALEKTVVDLQKLDTAENGAD